MRLTVLVACALLAGCADGGSGDGPGAGPGPTDGAPAVDPVADGRQPPVWQVGQWWRYTTPSGDETRVVTEQDDGAWTVDTTSPGAALFDARTDISMLGPQYRDDLSGSQGDERVRFFQWPLEEGASWDTTWDGVQRHIVVARDGDSWTFEAHEEELLRATYRYEPAVAWITEMVFYDDNGTEDFSIRIQDHGTDYEGTVVRAVLHASVQHPAGVHGAFLDVPQDARVWAQIRILCGDAVARTEAMPTDNPGPGIEAVGTPGCDIDDTHDIEATPGMWRVTTIASQVQAFAAEYVAYSIEETSFP